MFRNYIQYLLLRSCQLIPILLRIVITQPHSTLPSYSCYLESHYNLLIVGEVSDGLLPLIILTVIRQPCTKSQQNKRPVDSHQNSLSLEFQQKGGGKF